jgi:hypothetical protein
VRKLALIAALSMLTACAPDIQNKDAVQTSIVNYLKARQGEMALDMNSMDVVIGSLTFAAGGKEAHANVTFVPKRGGGDPMKFPYILDRKGNEWVVRAHTAGGSPHGSMGGNPHGASKAVLPPNHPPVNPTDKQP